MAKLYQAEAPCLVMFSGRGDTASMLWRICWAIASKPWKFCCRVCNGLWGRQNAAISERELETQLSGPPGSEQESESSGDEFRQLEPEVESQAAREWVNIAGMCCTTSNGTGSDAGSFGSTDLRASGPPVEEPRMTAWHAALGSGTASSKRLREIPDPLFRPPASRKADIFC